MAKQVTDLEIEISTLTSQIELVNLEFNKRTQDLELLNKRYIEREQNLVQLNTQITERTKILEQVAAQIAANEKIIAELDKEKVVKEQLFEDLIVKVAAEEKKSNELRASYKEMKKAVELISNPNAIEMPNLIGLTETLCNQLLLSLGLKLDAIYQNTNNSKAVNGQSIKQSVPEGIIVNSGETIAVVFAKKIV